MKTSNEENNMTNDEVKSPLKVIYVLYVGKNSDNENIYHLLITIDSELTWGEGWENKPACVMRSLTPEDDMYEYVAEVKTEVLLDLAQDNCCYSMQDCRDKVIALASENLEEAEEYPEEGRIVIHFGDLIEDVEKMLARRDITLSYI
jgi:hypothetical protein